MGIRGRRASGRQQRQRVDRRFAHSERLRRGAGGLRNLDLELVSLLTGPASSVVLLVGIVWYAARFVKETVVPAGSALVVKHLAQVDAVIARFEADRLSHDASQYECRSSCLECHYQSAQIREVQ